MSMRRHMANSGSAAGYSTSHVNRGWPSPVQLATKSQGLFDAYEQPGTRFGTRGLRRDGRRGDPTSARSWIRIDNSF